MMALKLPRTKDYLLKPLSAIELSRFDCGDNELNSFFVNNGKENEESLLSKIYFLTSISENDPLCAFSISNADIQACPQLNMTIPSEQHYKTYPAVRIGKLATHKDMQRKSLGSTVISLIKEWFTSDNKTGCRFVVVDARKEAMVENFYVKNGFEDYPIQENTSKTKLMYFDLLSYKKSF